MNAGHRLLDLLLGRLCVFCGNAVSFRAEASICPICKKETAVEPLHFSGMGLEHIQSLYPYTNLVRQGIHRYKLGGIADLGRFAAHRMAQKYKNDGKTVDLVTCVPSNWKRKRDYNQSELLAKYFAKEVGLPFEPYLLVKKSHVKSQTACRNRRERIGNAKNVYRLNCPKEKIEEKRILILDDVITTGATLASCAEQLLAAGATQVRAYTIAATIALPSPKLLLSGKNLSPHRNIPRQFTAPKGTVQKIQEQNVLFFKSPT